MIFAARALVIRYSPRPSHARSPLVGTRPGRARRVFVMLGILFVVALVAAVLAVVFFAQARSAGSAVLALRGELDKLRKDGEGERIALKEALAELKTRGQQLVEAREKLADARKKSEPRQAKAQNRGAREAELEEDLTHARSLAEQAHAAETAARKAAAAAKAAEDSAKAELARAQEKLRELAGGPAVSAPAAVAGPSADAGLIEAARKSDERHRAAEAKATLLEAQTNSLREREVKARDEARKAKGRAETNNKVFLVTKSDLDMTKERLAAAERMLWQAGLNLPAVPAKGRPKATGKASAERPREEKAAETPAAVAAPPAAAGAAADEPATAAASVAEGAAAAPASDSMTTPAGGVAPLRRRPGQPGVEAAKVE